MLAVGSIGVILCFFFSLWLLSVLRLEDQIEPSLAVFPTRDEFEKFVEMESAAMICGSLEKILLVESSRIGIMDGKMVINVIIRRDTPTTQENFADLFDQIEMILSNISERELEIVFVAPFFINNTGFHTPSNDSDFNVSFMMIYRWVNGELVRIE
jgi:hypothetical protein